MTAAWVGGDAQGNNALATSVTIPAGAPAGAIALVALPYNQGQAPGDSTVTSAGGAWTQLDSQDWSASFRARLFYRVLGSGEGGNVVSLTQPAGGSQKLSGAIGVMSGVTAIHINGMRIETTVTASHTAASATATKTVVQMAFITERESVPSITWTAPSGFTMGAQFHHIGSGATGVAVAYNLTPTSGSIGGGAWTETTPISNDALVMFVVGLEVPVEGSGNLAVTAGLTGAASVSKPASGDRSTTVGLTGAAAVSRGVGGNLAVTAALTGAAVTTKVASGNRAVSVGLTGTAEVTGSPQGVTAYVPRSPFLIEVWDGLTTPFVRKGRVASYVASEVVLRHNQVGSWKFTMTLTDGGVNLLTPPGRRITIDYRGKRILSGPVWGIRRSRQGIEDQVEVYGYSDLVWLNRRLAFPNPLDTFPADGVAFTQSSYADLYPGGGGPAESVVKYWVNRNCVIRQPVPTLSIAPDLARGPAKGDVPRFQTVLELCGRLADNASIGLSLKQVAAGLVFDIYEPALQPVRLSRSLGNLRDWEFVNEGPNATRIVNAGPGERDAREYTLQRLALSEVGWGITEAFMESSGETHADRVLDGSDFLYANSPTASFSVVPQDTESMRFGETYGLGDSVATELFPGITLTDIVREVTITDTVAEGVDVKPVVGNLQTAKRFDAVYLELRKLRLQINKHERQI